MKVLSHKLGAACAWLSVLVVIFVVLADRSGQVAAQGAPQRYTVNLPLVRNSGNAPTPTTPTPPPLPPTPTPAPLPAGPYSDLLARAAAACPALGLGQLCVVSGKVELQPKGGQAAPAAVGTTADLSALQSIALSSSGADLKTWGVALLRLRGDATAPELGLSALVFGNVRLSPTASAPNLAADAAPALPGFQLASTPVAGIAERGSSGLIVSSPSPDDLLSLTVNGATLTVGGSAFVEAQAGANLILTTARGIASAEVGDASSTAIQNDELLVPLTQDGQAAGAPGTARPSDPLISWVLEDLLVPILNDEQRKEYAADALSRLNRAIDRCVAGKATYVYNVLFWARAIEREPLLKSHSDPTKLAAATNRAPNCLTFEIDFDSTVTTTAALAEESNLKATNLSVSFHADGNDFISVDTPLDYVSYSVQGPGCPRTLPTTDGRLELADASLRIAGNGVRIATRLGVSQLPSEQIIMNCPTGPIVIDKRHWVPVFFRLHDDLWQRGEVHSFDFREWRYTAATAQCSKPNTAGGCEHFGEAIYTRQVSEGGFDFSGTTFLNLVHAPLK